MAGFATSGNTNKKSLIDQYLKTDKYLNQMGKGTHRLFVEQQREVWDKRYIGRNDNHLISIEDLFAKGSD